MTSLYKSCANQFARQTDLYLCEELVHSKEMHCLLSNSYKSYRENHQYTQVEQMIISISIQNGRMN